MIKIIFIKKYFIEALQKSTWEHLRIVCIGYLSDCTIESTHDERFSIGRRAIWGVHLPETPDRRHWGSLRFQDRSLVFAELSRLVSHLALWPRCLYQLLALDRSRPVVCKCIHSILWHRRDYKLKKRIKKVHGVS